MSTYAGEVIRLWSSATLEGVAVAGTDGVVATINIWRVSDAELLVDADTMTWDATATPTSAVTGAWLYDWDTTGIAAGKYRYQVILTGPGSFTSWEFSDVTLARSKVPTV